MDRHLDTWLANAIHALHLKVNEQYVVDQDRSHKNPDLNPLVTIIDADTGTDQSHSQWDGALHQFLQLKELCQISIQSLKAVFVSNVSYIQLYSLLIGLTGTLGSEPERSFLQRMYKSEYLTVPTAFPKQFTNQQAQILTDESSWLSAITNESSIILKKNRSMIIFCSSIRQVQTVYDLLKREFFHGDKIGQLHCYARDYEIFGFETQDLLPGHIIVATNLAGRGTDIRINEQLSKNGGLHVCLTYLPDNVRIEEQVLVYIIY